MTNEWLLIFSENWRGYLSEKQMALHPKDTPRQDKELFSWSFANGNIPHSLEKVTHFIFLYHSSSSQHRCSLGPLTSQYLENGAGARTHSVFKVFTQHLPAPCSCGVPAMPVVASFNPVSHKQQGHWTFPL